MFTAFFHTKKEWTLLVKPECQFRRVWGWNGPKSSVLGGPPRRPRPADDAAPAPLAGDPEPVEGDRAAGGRALLQVVRHPERDVR